MNQVQPRQFRFQHTVVLVSGLLLLLPIGRTQAQFSPPSPTLQIATRLAKPDVFEEEGKLVGFSVDLWRSLAEQLQVEPEAKIYASSAELLAAIESGQADLGIAAITITTEREANFDFSYPILTSGLQIMIPAQSARRRLLPRLVAVFLSPDVLQLVGIAFLLMIIPAHIIWFAESRHLSGLVQCRSYFPGIFKVYWWAAATLATQADEMPKSVIGRLTAVVWMLTGVLFAAAFTAAVTTSLTVEKLQSNISGPADLLGKRIVTVSDSAATIYLNQHNIPWTGFSQLEQTYNALLMGKADAVVLDAPVLQYFANHDGKGKVQIVGDIFQEETYAIVFPQDSPYRESVNRAIVMLKENGTYRKIYEKWFGSDSL